MSYVDIELTNDVLIDRIEHEYLFYCSNLVVNGCFLISNPNKYHKYDSKEIVQFMYQTFLWLGKKFMS